MHRSLSKPRPLSIALDDAFAAVYSETMQLGIVSATQIMAENNTAPSEVLLLHDGDLDIPGKGMAGVMLDADSAKSIIATFNEHGVDLPIDYHHSTHRVEPGQKAIASGWITALEYREGEGLIGKVKWTDTARAEIESKQYRYLSPVILWDQESKRVFKLVSAALTNIPATRRMPELIAAESRWSPCTIGDDGEITLTSTDWSKPMAKKKKQTQADEHGLDGAPGEVGDVGEGMVEVEAATIEAVAQAVVAKGGELPEGAGPMEILAMAIDMLAGANPDEVAASTVSKRTVTEEMADALDIEKDSTLELACAEINKMKVKLGSGDSIAKRLKQLEAEAQQRNDADKKRAIETMVDSHVEAGRLNPNDDKQMKGIRAMAETDIESANEFAGSLTAIGAPGKMDFTGSVPKNSREKVMAESRKYWNDHPEERMGSSVAMWISNDLDEVGEGKLTTAELEKMEA